MSATTAIEWTDRTWNPITGCTKVSPGCDNCYAEGIAHRFAGGKAFPHSFDVTLRPERLGDPLRWRKPARVFVNSMSDLFHDQVSTEYIAHVWAVMATASAHTFQVLTKRHGRMRSVLNSPDFYDLVLEIVHVDLDLTSDAADRVLRRSWPYSNVWLGVSVEDQKRADLRIPALLDTPAAVRFLSCEPLLSAVDLTQWLGADEQERGTRVGTRGAGCPECGRGRPGVASPGDDAGIGNRGSGGALLAATGGHRPVAEGRVSTGAGDDRPGAGHSAGASPRLDGGQSTDDPAWFRAESQERDQGRQPAGELGADDARREHSPRPARTGAVPVEPGREAHAGAGNADTAPARQRAGVTCAGCGAVRGQHSGREEDRAPRHLGVAARGIDWIIVGGESGRNARPMHQNWARDLRDQCQTSGVPFFFKQWGEFRPLAGNECAFAGDVYPPGVYDGAMSRRVGKKAAGRELDGRTWDEFPTEVTT